MNNHELRQRIEIILLKIYRNEQITLDEAINELEAIAVEFANK